MLEAIDMEKSGPTPTGIPFEIRGKVKAIKGRKVLVDMTLVADGKLCAEASVVMVQIPSQYLKG